MRWLACGAALALAACASAPAGSSDTGTLDVYFIDVEGGKAVLARTPGGTSILLDAGFPGAGTFAATPGPPAQARDAQRILAAARDAHVDRIDYFVSSHYHADHLGGVLELAQLLPIGTFVDHAAPSAAAEAGVPGTQALYEAYARLRARGKHLRPAAGDRLPIGGVDVTVVATDGATTATPLATPLAVGGAPNAACASPAVPAQEPTENPRSLAVLVQLGRFRLLDPGDLSGAPLHALACPMNRVGPVDAYVVAHHGGPDAADPAVFAALRPRVTVTSNGPRKGGHPTTLAAIRALPSTDGWQLHRSLDGGAGNAPDERLANLDETTAAWLKLSARADGSFTVTNGRTGVSTSYAPSSTPSSTPSRAGYREVVSGCSGGFSGGGTGAVLLADGQLLQWRRDRAGVPESRTAVRTDTALAAETVRELARIRFMEITHAERGNLTCFLRARTDSTEHEVSWPVNDTKAPKVVRDLFDRLQGAIGR